MTDRSPDVWSFALALYERPGVAEACLTLQDDFGADVVLVIGLCWLTLCDGELSDVTEIARLDAALAPWRTATIEPLRNLRRALKPRLPDLPPAAAEMRETIKAAELQAERVAFELLERAAVGRTVSLCSESTPAMVKNVLMRYLDRPEGANGAVLQGLLQHLADATYELSGASFPASG